MENGTAWGQPTLEQTGLRLMELVCANAECRATFLWEYKGGGGKLREYCTEKCRRTAKRRRQGGRPRPDVTVLPESKTCAKCHETKPLDAFHVRLMPSGFVRPVPRCIECMQADDRARRPKKAGPRPCAWCQGEFTPKTDNGLYCTKSCRSAAMRDRSKKVHALEPVPDDGMKVCRTCSKRKPLEEFTDKGNGLRGPDCKSCHGREAKAAKRRAKLGLKHAPRPKGRTKPDGYTYRDPHGYIHQKRVGHHRADKRGFVGQHILAFEDHYGVKVPRGYTVHHKDDDRSNNHWRNLDLRVGQHGKHGNAIPTLLRHEEYLVETLETIVSDPLYLARNLAMLRDLGLIPAA